MLLQPPIQNSRVIKNMPFGLSRYGLIFSVQNKEMYICGRVIYGKQFDLSAATLIKSNPTAKV